ncbi:enoyl-CoA hydratase/isomerase family protein [Williamsia phyllosphaerae]|uniref:Enoyl-CoA hydratase n=1 Tax=Williamsia phyllosphaerae TaxID=885042 RepID=A0ABQ1U4N3_9NOCA|nr:enoyl-CoA hydratase/isomerase family protein [Williamsia phyllosphaerae]GGF10041.1 enoyl-CoA hydratase [Williamsia phyllosphaerae]
MPHLTRDDSIFVLHLNDEGVGDDENVFGPTQVAKINELLDEVEASDGPTALVTTALGKFYSTGLDTAWVLANVDDVDPYVESVQILLARILTFPMPTVAAVTGHAFGGGALFALAHDHVVMRSDRGYLCMPGVTIGASYAPGSVMLVADKVPARVNHEMLVTGRRYGGAQAGELGIVDDAVTLDEVLPAALQYARTHQNTRGRTIGEIKSSMYAVTAAALRTTVSGVGGQAAIADS